MTAVAKIENLMPKVGQTVKSIGGNLPIQVTDVLSLNVHYMTTSKKVIFLKEAEIVALTDKILKSAYVETGNKLPGEQEYFVLMQAISEDLQQNFKHLTANEIYNAVRKGIRSEDFKGVTAVNIFKILETYKKSSLRADSMILIQNMKEKLEEKPKEPTNYVQVFENFKAHLQDLQVKIQEKGKYDEAIVKIPFYVYFDFLEKCQLKLANTEERKIAYLEALKILKHRNTHDREKNLVQRNIYGAELDSNPKHPHAIAEAKKIILKNYLDDLAVLDKNIADMLTENELNHYLKTCQNEPQ